MNYILFDGDERNQLLPFTYTRPVAEIRIGILTITGKWEMMLSEKLSHLTQDYLQEKFQLHVEAENILINGSVLPNDFLVDVIISLKQDEKLVYENTLVAIGASQNEIENQSIFETAKKTLQINPPHAPSLKSAPAHESETSNFKPQTLNLQHTWDIFRLNDFALRADFALITTGRKSQHIYAPNQLMGFENIFIEEGAKVYASILNATAGPIYIGKNAEVMEGSLIRGPFSLGENSTLKMGSKIYGATTIGNDCKVGGEVNNTVIFDYSNKAHEGYVGNSVIGQWCNLGADTNTSNLKNNYSNVKVWSFGDGKYVDTGLQFCGLAMGDHSKCSINTQFNTGTVVGVCTNIFGEGFPPKNIANFNWGGAKGFEKFELNKAIELAERVYARRGLTFDETEKNIFRHLSRMG